ALWLRRSPRCRRRRWRFSWVSYCTPDPAQSMYLCAKHLCSTCLAHRGYSWRMTNTVLVTGGSGFIGGHTILQLLSEGHTVRATVRSLKREAEVRALLKSGGAGADSGDRLSFVEADLEKDASWAQAVAGCDYVLHLASPFPPDVPKHEDELIVP